MDSKTYFTEKICWKWASKFLLINGDITEDIYMKLYDMDKLEENGYEIPIDIFTKLNDVIVVYPEEVSEIIKEEVNFLINGNIYNELLWVSYLVECLVEGYITGEKYEKYRNAIDFTLPLGKKEYYIINEILDYLRVEGVKRVPSLIDDFKNPSFDVLMAANKLC